MSTNSTRRRPDDPARLCVWLLVGTAVLHLGFGAVMGRSLWDAVLDGGVAGSALLDDPARSGWFWFTLAGLPMLAPPHR